jgi:hypothetical protein
MKLLYFLPEHMQVSMVPSVANRVTCIRIELGLKLGCVNNFVLNSLQLALAQDSDHEL